MRSSPWAVAGTLCLLFCVPATAQQDCPKLLGFLNQVDKDPKDGMLDVSEFTTLLQLFSDDTTKDMTYHNMALLMDICDVGFTQPWGTIDPSLAGDGKLTLDEMTGGLHALRHMGPVPCPADCWCASVCETGMEGCNCATVDTSPCIHGVTDAQCVATQAKDILSVYLDSNPCTVCLPDGRPTFESLRRQLDD